MEQIREALDAYRAERDAAAALPDGGPAKVILAGQALANALQSLLDQPDVPDELLTYGERIHIQRAAALQELEAFGLGPTTDNRDALVSNIENADDAREVLAVAQTLEVLDRIIHRRDRRAELLPATLSTQVINAPSEGELRLAIWNACEEAGTTTEVADTVIIGTLKALGFEPQGERATAELADRVDADNDSGASG